MRGTAQSLYKELDDWRVYCLCKRKGNMSMWAKYAGNHTGYCLEFANIGPFFGSVPVPCGRTNVRPCFREQQYPTAPGLHSSPLEIGRAHV